MLYEVITFSLSAFRFSSSRRFSSFVGARLTTLIPIEGAGSGFAAGALGAAVAAGFGFAAGAASFLGCSFFSA